MPTPRSFAAVARVFNTGVMRGGDTGIVVAGGRTAGGTASPVVEEYIVEDDAWVARRPLPGARVGAAAASVVEPGALDTRDVQVWLVGGQVAEVVVAGALRYGRNQDYAQLLDTEQPEPRFMHAAAALDGVVYVFGGRDFTQETSGWAFEPETATWSDLPDLPSVQSGAGAAAVGGRVYAIGGADGFGNAVATVRAYEPAERRWIDRRPMTVARRDPAVTVMDGEIWVIGGWNNGARPSVEIYAPATDTWRNGTLLPEPRTGAVAVAHSGEVYVAGGEDSAGAPRASILKSAGGAWQLVTDHSGTGVSHAAAAIVGDDTLTLFGGTRGDDASRSVWSEQLVTEVLQTRGVSLLRAARQPAWAALRGRLYLFGGSEDGDAGTAEVTQIELRCFDGVRNGRESGVDEGGGCPFGQDGDLRLAGGTTSGRLEVLHDGSWRGVCDDAWGDDDTRVVCRQLFGRGYTGSHTPGQSGSDVFWLDNVECTGDEDRLADCRHAGWGVEDCSSSENVTVTCQAQ
jgi:N-acetylneuraminic acid mutarotase